LTAISESLMPGPFCGEVVSGAECSQCRGPLESIPRGTLELRCCRCRPQRRSLLSYLRADSEAASVPCKDWRLPAEFANSYQLVQVVGRGAAGVVVEAIQTSLDRTVAIKFLASPNDMDNVQRFIREGKMLARIKSDHVVKIYEHGEVLDSVYLVMELLNSGSLRKLLDRNAPLSLAECIRILEPVLHGLHDCHRIGVIHRDVKPENILFDGAGRPKLVDLGIARILGERQHLTASGALIGTVGYLAPERIAGAPEAPAFDLYSVAVVLFEMLTGRRPFESHSLSEVIQSQRQQEPPDARRFVPQLPAPVARFLSRSLSPRQDGRPLSAQEFLSDLLEAQNASRMSGAPRSPRNTSTRKYASFEPKAAPRLWRPRIVLFCMILLLLGTLLSTGWCHRPETGGMGVVHEQE
jgi:serine/threonine protein kinase